MRLDWIALWLAAAALCIIHSASAHVVLAGREAPVGTYYKAVFRLPHGCAGAPTTALRVELPAAILVAKPQPKAGWHLAMQREPLAQPVMNEGHELTERVKSIRWDGGTLPDDEFEEFAILVRLPAQSGPLAFPVVQVCGETSVDWVEPPAAEGGKVPAHPAPSLLLTPPGPRGCKARPEH